MKNEVAYALVFKKSGEIARSLYTDQFLVFGRKSVAMSELTDYDSDEEEYNLEVRKITVTL